MKVLQMMNKIMKMTMMRMKMMIMTMMKMLHQRNAHIKMIYKQILEKIQNKIIINSNCKYKWKKKKKSHQSFYNFKKESIRGLNLLGMLQVV